MFPILVRRLVLRIHDGLSEFAVYRLFSHRLLVWWCLGRRYFCPICEGRFRRLLTREAPNVKCPRCGSRERQRLCWLYFKEKTDFFVRPRRLLQVGPDPSLLAGFRPYAHLRCVTTDLTGRSAQILTDLTRPGFADAAFDMVICLHVLEHIPDERSAMRALYRALKPGGWAIFMVPLDPHKRETLEDPTADTPEKRLLLFGQRDHVRLYGRGDFADRLREAGFQVTEEDYYRRLPPEVRDRCRLDEGDIIFSCSRPP